MKTPEEKAQLIKEHADEFDKQLTYVKIDLLKNDATTFLTGEVFKRPIIFSPNLPVPTAGANGKEILIDPECWMNTTRPKRLGILFHEGFHNMMGHCDIKSTSKDDHIIWNLAMDCVTEALRVTCGVGEQIEEAAIKPSHDGNVRLKINDVKIILPRCHEKTKEEIHDVIVAHVKKNPPKNGGKMEITDEDGNELKDIDNHDIREFTPDERAEMEQNLRQMIVENKLKGNLPGGLAKVLERMLAGKVNWKAELRDMVLQLRDTVANNN
jgi:predicted metal-dependent peptidase